QWAAADKELTADEWEGHHSKATTEEFRKLSDEIRRQRTAARQAEGDAEAEALRRRYTPPPAPPRRRPTR
ncbi:MAG TPA: hypothetical protein VEA69_01910, partial [Tepidisphaeraceae bacterium]|nr:hypothetical protein [Tepidisphaeraceae bacterium]